MPSYIVASVDEIRPGKRKIVEVAGRSIGIFNVEGEFLALRNRCPHQGGPLCLGPLVGALESTTPGEYTFSRSGELIRCPWHGWEFDLRTGESWFDPAQTRARSYQVSVRDQTELEPHADAPVPGLVRGPYEVETYAVRAKSQYLVIEIES